MGTGIFAAQVLDKIGSVLRPPAHVHIVTEIAGFSDCRFYPMRERVSRWHPVCDGEEFFPFFGGLRASQPRAWQIEGGRPPSQGLCRRALPSASVSKIGAGTAREWGGVETSPAPSTAARGRRSKPPDRP